MIRGSHQPLTPPPPGSFAWWLTQAHGFLVDDEADRPVGVVEDIHVDHHTGHACELIVVEGWGRRWLVIPADAVTQIAPADRRLTVACPPTQDQWPQARDHQSPWLLRALGGTLRVARRLISPRR